MRVPVQPGVGEIPPGFVLEKATPGKSKANDEVDAAQMDALFKHMGMSSSTMYSRIANTSGYHFH